MGTLASELRPHVEKLTSQPLIYADANVPAGVVRHMRRRLQWDVLAVIEDQHYRTASRLRRTLISLDDDFLDDRRFPAAASGGVIILSAPDERGLVRLLTKVDRAFFGSGRGGRRAPVLPLAGQKIQLHPDWSYPVTTRCRLH
jgi:hypothetical protein